MIVIAWRQSGSGSRLRGYDAGLFTHDDWVRRRVTVREAYPLRLSTDELRAELGAYADERKRSGSAASTVDLDRRKVEYFLRWLDTGTLPGQGG